LQGFLKSKTTLLGVLPLDPDKESYLFKDLAVVGKSLTQKVVNAIS